MAMILIIIGLLVFGIGTLVFLTLEYFKLVLLCLVCFLATIGGLVYHGSTEYNKKTAQNNEACASCCDTYNVSIAESGVHNHRLCVKGCIALKAAYELELSDLENSCVEVIPGLFWKYVETQVLNYPRSEEVKNKE